MPFGAGLLLWLPFFAAGGMVVALVWPGLKPALRGPVVVYVIVIAAMAGQATGRWYASGSAVTLAAAVGAGLFVVSDAVLAIDRFRWPFRAARAVTLATYWADRDFRISRLASFSATHSPAADWPCPWWPSWPGRPAR